MDVDKMGICVTIIVLVGVLGIGVLGEIEIPDYININLPQVETETESAQSDERLSNAYFDWCYKMKIEC